eukprot:SAG11_NODE_2078_length_3855_cov_2.006124_1_plen_536_part_10
MCGTVSTVTQLSSEVCHPQDRRSTIMKGMRVLVLLFVSTLLATLLLSLRESLRDHERDHGTEPLTWRLRSCNQSRCRDISCNLLDTLPVRPVPLETGTVGKREHGTDNCAMKTFWMQQPDDAYGQSILWRTSLLRAGYEEIDDRDLACVGIITKPGPDRDALLQRKAAGANSGQLINDLPYHVDSSPEPIVRAEMLRRALGRGAAQLRCRPAEIARQQARWLNQTVCVKLLEAAIQAERSESGSAGANTVVHPDRHPEQSARIMPVASLPRPSWEVGRQEASGAPAHTQLLGLRDLRSVWGLLLPNSTQRASTSKTWRLYSARSEPESAKLRARLGVICAAGLRNGDLFKPTPSTLKTVAREIALLAAAQGTGDARAPAPAPAPAPPTRAGAEERKLWLRPAANMLPISSIPAAGAAARTSKSTMPGATAPRGVLQRSVEYEMELRVYLLFASLAPKVAYVRAGYARVWPVQSVVTDEWRSSRLHNSSGTTAIELGAVCCLSPVIPRTHPLFPSSFSLSLSLSPSLSLSLSLSPAL